MSTVVLYCWYHNDSASVLLYFTFLSHLFPLPCGAGSPRGVRLKCYYAYFLVWCGCDTSYIVSVHDQCQASIYTLSLCRGHSWRVRLAKQETLTPPVHLVSPLFAGVRECPLWCSIVGATVTVHQFFCILHYRATVTVHQFFCILHYQNCTVLATKYPGFFYTKHPVIILRAPLFVVTPSHVASWKIECQNFLMFIVAENTGSVNIKL